MLERNYFEPRIINEKRLGWEIAIGHLMGKKTTVIGRAGNEYSVHTGSHLRTPWGFDRPIREDTYSQANVPEGYVRIRQSRLGLRRR